VIGYFAYNNLGYCLIQLGHFAEAEALCRQAIRRDPHRQNAHKNLGLALVGQGRYPDAAWSLLAAVHAEPRDPRAVRHLEALRRDHGAALAADAALTAALAACRALGREQN
jgi:Flp pilus assembly protein TadD